MARSVIVMRHAPDLFATVRSVLLADPRFEDTGDLLHCDGTTAPLTNIYRVETLPAEWEGWAEVGLPDPQNAFSLVFETRSAEWGGGGRDASRGWVEAADLVRRCRRGGLAGWRGGPRAGSTGLTGALA